MKFKCLEQLPWEDYDACLSMAVIIPFLLIKLVEKSGTVVLVVPNSNGEPEKGAGEMIDEILNGQPFKARRVVVSVDEFRKEDYIRKLLTPPEGIPGSRAVTFFYTPKFGRFFKEELGVAMLVESGSP